MIQRKIKKDSEISRKCMTSLHRYKLYPSDSLKLGGKVNAKDKSADMR